MFLAAATICAKTKKNNKICHKKIRERMRFVTRDELGAYQVDDVVGFDDVGLFVVLCFEGSKRDGGPMGAVGRNFEILFVGMKKKGW